MTAQVDVRREFPSHNGASQARLAHGTRCVVVVIEPIESRAVTMRGSIVLVPEEARALAEGLLREAAESERRYG